MSALAFTLSMFNESVFNTMGLATNFVATALRFLPGFIMGASCGMIASLDAGRSLGFQIKPFNSLSFSLKVVTGP